MEVFKQIGRADELGSEVRNVFKYGRIYGKSEPVFEEGDIFRTIIAYSHTSKVKSQADESVLKESDANISISDKCNDAVNILFFQTSNFHNFFVINIRVSIKHQ